MSLRRGCQSLLDRLVALDTVKQIRHAASTRSLVTLQVLDSLLSFLVFMGFYIVLCYHQLVILPIFLHFLNINNRLVLLL